MQEKGPSIRKITKNTTFLYVRMIAIMIVQFFTVRITLQYLGVENYGIYNAVCGVSNVFVFLTHAMTSASQRFLAYDLGEGNACRLKNTFDSLLLLFFIISVLIFLLLQTAGSWFVSHKLVITPDRMHAAMVAFFITNIMLVANIMTIPLNSLIIAHEDMNVFAYISIIDVLVKVGIVYALTIIPYDKLITYAFLLLLASLLNPALYWIYARLHYEECKSRPHFNKDIFKDIIPFMSWNLLGGVSWMLCTQGLSILVNIFFGPIINAAKAIADKVNTSITGFSNNFMVATQPQIIKTYAAGKLNDMYKVIFFSSNIACFLLYIIAIPVIFNTAPLLKLWLKDVPLMTVQMTQLVLASSFIGALEAPITQAIRATGDIKEYQIKISSLTLLVLPLAYVFFKCGLPAFYGYWAFIIIYAITLLYRVHFMHKQISMPYGLYFKSVFGKQLKCIIPIILLNMLCKFTIPNNNILGLFALLIIDVILSAITIFFIGLDFDERKKIVSLIKSKVHGKR